MYNLRICMAALAATVASLSTTQASAQSFPSRQITIVVAFAVGGPADIIARAVAPSLSSQLGRPVNVENRPGANGKLAIQTVLKAPRDGHTFAYISSSIMSVAPLLDKEFATMSGEIVPLTTALQTSNAIVVHPSLNVKTVGELVAYAKANPGKLFYGSIGEGSWYHFATEKMLSGLGIAATHVAYKGEAPALQDLVSGSIQLMIISAAGKSAIDTGKIIPIASTGRDPAVFYPQAPALSSSGIPGVADYDDTPWVGFGIATGVPDDIVATLHAALVTALKSDEVKKRVAVFGDTQTSTIDELRKKIAAERASNLSLVTSGRIKLEGSQ